MRSELEISPFTPKGVSLEPSCKKSAGSDVSLYQYLQSLILINFFPNIPANSSCNIGAVLNILINISLQVSLRLPVTIFSCEGAGRQVQSFANKVQ